VNWREAQDLALYGVISASDPLQSKVLSCTGTAIHNRAIKKFYMVSFFANLDRDQDPITSLLFDLR
jgi:cytoplasmic iron level regulating protein YaaA (DUF328/UPF0246 family)